MRQFLTTRLRAAARFMRAEPVLLAAIVMIAGGAVLFIDLAEDLGDADHQSFDETVLRWLHPGPDFADPIGPAWLDRAMADVTSLGSLAVLGLMGVAVLGYLLIEKRLAQAGLLVLSLAGGLVLSETMKSVFERTRPPDVYHAAGALNASFPSGHALLATTAYLTLGAMLAQAMTRRRLRVYAVAWGVALAVLVGVSRIYLGVHWASDVLAGWALGAAWAMACWLVERWMLRRERGDV